MIYFASDFHLGVPDKATSKVREKAICSWLEFAAKDATEIFLLGDVFDFWFEYKHAIPKGYVRLFGTLAKLTDAGIKITMFRGNHDMWMLNYFEDEFGVKVVSDELILERNGKRFFIHHGDGLGDGDKTYKFFKAVSRSGWARWLYARMHPNAGIALGNWFSRKSRISQKGRYEKYLGDEKEFLTQYSISLAEKEKYDYMIFGHRHLVLDMEVSPGCRYINLGEWVNGSTYAVFDGENLVLKQWDKA